MSTSAPRGRSRERLTSLFCALSQGNSAFRSFAQARPSERNWLLMTAPHLLALVDFLTVMFGSDEGPWNHSFRLEHKLGPRLKVVALIDPSAERANAALSAKRDSFVVSAYQDTMVYKDVKEYARAVNGGSVKQAQ